MTHTIVLFYKYTKIKNPELEVARQRAALEVLGITGRFIVAEEGINGTGEGTTENVAKYVEWMKSQKQYKDIHWKLSAGAGDSFPKLSVKVRSEIVSLHLGEKDLNPNKVTGKRLAPSQLHDWYENKKDFVVVDMRNDYELLSGKFENTIFPGLENFRDLKEKIAEIGDLKDKTVVTVCTGGVRCEKASGYLVNEGFKDVYQLDGGIVSYMAAHPSAHYKGSLYVFDKRVTMHFNDPDKHEMIGRCGRCDAASERYVNCDNLMCHKHFIECENCTEKEGGKFCSVACKETVSATVVN